MELNNHLEDANGNTYHSFTDLSTVMGPLAYLMHCLYALFKIDSKKIFIQIKLSLKKSKF